MALHKTHLTPTSSLLQKLRPQYQALHLLVAAIYFFAVARKSDAFDHCSALQRHIRTLHFQILDEGDVIAIFQFTAV